MNYRKIRCLAVLLSLLLGSAFSFARDGAQKNTGKLFSGFDGGMMLHSGYLKGNISEIDFPVEGAPFGIGGVIRLHLGEHWRIGTEGYMSKLSQLGNGSHLKYFWCGLLSDYRLHFGDFSAFAGLTLGGGVNTDLLMFEEPSRAWAPIQNTVFHKIPFFAIDPFIGVEYGLSEAMRLCVKLDCLRALSSQSASIAMGPRLYFGFIFSH